MSGLISRGMTGTGLRVRGGNSRFKISRARFEDGIQLNWFLGSCKGRIGKFNSGQGEENVFERVGVGGGCTDGVCLHYH